ncbi:hypothetical protein C809_02206 [Lachnospiraceae bacterium MD335]|nr:hypothetical protein C809_02206 [Lachnospiraceae bacterium MD335]
MKWKQVGVLERIKNMTKWQIFWTVATLLASITAIGAVDG